LPGLKATDILTGFKKFESDVSYEEQKWLQQWCGDRLMSFTDASIFPDSLGTDTSLPASQLHSLALVQSTEPLLASWASTRSSSAFSCLPVAGATCLPVAGATITLRPEQKLMPSLSSEKFCFHSKLTKHYIPCSKN
jgi:hypothetical protein